MNDLSDTPLGFHVNFAKLVADHVRARDLDAAPVLDALGLDPRAWDHATGWVSARALTEALHRAARLCDDPHIGLTIGQQVRPANMGPLGYALISCADLRDGLALFERLQGLVWTQVQAEHRLKGPLIESRLLTVGDVPRDTLLWTFVLVSRLAFARWVCGRRLTPLHVCLPCPSPADPAPLLAYVGGPLRFDADMAGEQVPSDWLALPNPNADAGLHQVMSTLTDQQWASQRRDPTQLATVLRQHIAARLQQGSWPQLQEISPDLEDALGLTSRQLQRRLAEHGLNFKTMVEQVRQEQVLHDLRHTNLPLAEVARRAAYAEVSSMHRAVRRWTGQTPLAVRQGPAGAGLSP